ncbi:nuclear envelope phosphatase-regulatory subunit 1 isoform X2 [Dasypus novemcinctus]|uniref:nuclear envelope phosphatase-regulatory subunit 1 isoform X2 n=1 Tax=Dasypus novemcinctus TaxID=9361 RepID=UPI0039C9050C
MELVNRSRDTKGVTNSKASGWLEETRERMNMANWKVSFFTSLWNHPFFTISCITLIGLFFAGIHKRVVAPSIIAARCRTVLAEYNMSCDDTGKLILKPRPHVQ